LSVFGTQANEAGSGSDTSKKSDPLEVMQDAHFMQLLLAQLRAPDARASKNDQKILELIDPAHASN
jgi:hypothetical protein